MVRSIRAKLMLLYIGSFGMVILLFTVIAFFSLQNILLKSLDNTLYNGAKRLEYELFIDPLIPYELRCKLSTGYETCLAEEIEEIFLTSVVYVQIMKMSDNHFYCGRYGERNSGRIVAIRF